MGECFSWVNPDKKEYICPQDFNCGGRRYQTIYENNEVLCALRELLSYEWKECRILWLGDECNAPEGIAEDLFGLMLEHSNELGYSGGLYDTVLDSYRNVSGLFKSAEKYVREEIEEYIEDQKNGGEYIPVNEYGIDISDPYKGLFIKDGKIFKYTLNHTKKIGYSMEEFTLFSDKGLELDHFDPLPVLLGYGSALEPGLWLGDDIGVSDSLPRNYQQMRELCIKW